MSPGFFLFSIFYFSFVIFYLSFSLLKIIQLIQIDPNDK